MRNRIAIFLACALPFVGWAQDNTENNIKSTSYQVPVTISQINSTTIPLDNKIETITYSDGLGRPKQRISLRAGGDREDIIQYIEYDDMGREQKQYLPYATTGQVANNQSGMYTPNAAVKTLIEDFYNTDKYDNTLNPYSETVFERSPRSRPKEVGAPGNDWRTSLHVPSADVHSIRTQYSFNSIDEVRKFAVIYGATTDSPSLLIDGFYSENELTKTTLLDENWTPAKGIYGKSYTYTNKTGQILLKRQSVAGDAISPSDPNFHDTYYIYDDFGNLVYVIPPEGVKALINVVGSVTPIILDTSCYQYKYDYRNRIIEKKIPGKGWEYIVYDKLDRPVLTQDQNLKGDNKWLFTKYDVYGRVAYTGFFNGVGTRQNIQNAVNNNPVHYVERTSQSINIGDTSLFYTVGEYPRVALEVLTINYYDTYVDYVGVDYPTLVLGQKTTNHSDVSTTTVGLPTVSKVRVLGEDDWITTLNSYDEKGRLIYVASKNDYLSTNDTSRTLLDFTGKPLENHTTHLKSGNASINIYDHYTYDHMGRLKTHTQDIDGGPMQLITNNTYDDLGQLINKKVGGELFEEGLTDPTSNLTIDAAGVVTKTSGGTSWNAGVYTKGQLEGNGGLSFTVNSKGETHMVGFNTGASNNNSHSDLNYTFYFTGTTESNARVKVRINGSNVSVINRNYEIGDIFNIELLENTILFFHNGEQVYAYTLIGAIEGLIGDTSFYTEGSSIANLELYLTENSRHLQAVDYSYNVRGWLTDINNVAANDISQNNNDDLFNFKINYNKVDESNSTALFNGNIAETFWQTKNSDSEVRGYSYEYDTMNRILSATSYQGLNLSSIAVNNNFDLGNISYDKNGNILTLNRRGYEEDNGLPIYNMYDDLTYSYNGNQLIKVDDTGSANGFLDGNPQASGIDDYRYDANGNMVLDENKDISLIKYNHLNLPVKVEFNGSSNDNISYIYDATGVKLGKIVNKSLASPVRTQYAGGFIYSDGEQVNNLQLQFISQPEGYIVPTVVGGTKSNKIVKGFDTTTGETTYSNYAYVFQYKDHLGNVRLSYGDTNLDGAIQTTGEQSEIIEESNYYPFGLEQKGYNNTVQGGNSLAQRWKYNGVEYNEDLDLNLYEMDVRMYDPAIARFNGIDPVTHHSMGTSVAFDNNPVFWADPSGADGIGMMPIAASGHRGFSEIGGSSLMLDITDADGNTTSEFITNSEATNLSNNLLGQNNGVKINNSQTPKGAYVSASVNAEFGLQSKEGSRLFGIGDKIEIGASVQVAKAELLIGLETNEIYLNIELINNSDVNFVVGGHSVAGGGSIEFSYDPREGALSLSSNSVDVGPIGSSFSQNGITNNFEFASFSKTYLGSISLTASVSIENISSSSIKGTPADGMAMANNSMSAQVRMRIHRQQQEALMKNKRILEKKLRRATIRSAMSYPSGNGSNRKIHRRNGY